MENFKEKATIILGLILVLAGLFHLWMFPYVIEKYHLEVSYKDYFATAGVILGCILVVRPDALPNLVMAVIRRIFNQKEEKPPQTP